MKIADFVTDFADQAVILPLTLVVAIVLLAAGWWRGAIVWTGTIGATLAAALLLKMGFMSCGHLIPDLVMRGPSGHTAASGAVYGDLAAIGARIVHGTESRKATFLVVGRHHPGRHHHRRVPSRAWRSYGAGSGCRWNRGRLWSRRVRLARREGASYLAGSATRRKRHHGHRASTRSSNARRGRHSKPRLRFLAIFQVSLVTKQPVHYLINWQSKTKVSVEALSIKVASALF